MSEFICVTCGTQYSEQPTPPDQCLICTEERQYVGWQGQQWTTLEQLRLDHRNRVAPEAPGGRYGAAQARRRARYAATCIRFPQVRLSQ